mmetsp:Transcript_19323/g.47354  ORF Transcript_19323/g.47354 Transcript_19323/m.47354 type:complete len:209 (+) Transcript_19323:311-937(+)
MFCIMPSTRKKTAIGANSIDATVITNLIATVLFSGRFIIPMNPSRDGGLAFSALNRMTSILGTSTVPTSVAAVTATVSCSRGHLQDATHCGPTSSLWGSVGTPHSANTTITRRSGARPRSCGRLSFPGSGVEASPRVDSTSTACRRMSSSTSGGVQTSNTDAPASGISCGSWKTLQPPASATAMSWSVGSVTAQSLSSMPSSLARARH